MDFTKWDARPPFHFPTIQNLYTDTDPMFAAFNVGEYRRAVTDKYKSHDFFRPDNAEAIAIRQYVNRTLNYASM